MSAETTVNVNGGRKIGTLRVEKEYQSDSGTLVFRFVEIVKDTKTEEIVGRNILGVWDKEVCNFPQAILDRAMEHGFLQKFGDALAGRKEYTIDECSQILDDMATGMIAGDWNKKGQTKSEKVKAVDTDAIDAVLASNPAFATMDRDTAIALIKSLGLMKK